MTNQLTGIIKKICPIVLFAAFYANLALAQDAPQCKQVKLADCGWTDVSATTAVAAELLASLGYEPQIDLLSVPVTFTSLKNQDVDVFLGNWMPTQTADIAPYLEAGSIEQLGKNLTGAKFALAVPRYVYEAGVRSLADLAKFEAKFHKRIYGIEPGNDGNRQILKMIGGDSFGLGDWKLVESSEQGMLAEVKQAVKENKWIVYLGWAPHPMNKAIQMEYLAGGDEFFGPNLGEASVFTTVRKGLAKECPNLAQFFTNLVFSVDAENELMSLILDQGKKPREAAETWLSSHPETKKAWLMGVAPFGMALTKTGHEPSKVKKIPIGALVEEGVLSMTNDLAGPFRHFSESIETGIVKLTSFLLAIPVWLVIAVACFMIWFWRRAKVLALMSGLGLMLIFNLGLWDETIQTLVLVVSASAIAVALGVPLGILGAYRPGFFRIMRPALDLMQTVPTFVYLIPTLMLFGLGMVPGLVATVIFALPASIRLTELGIRKTPAELKDTARAFGASWWQKLVKVELPYAKPSIMEGISQSIMLSLSMVVIAALVGADGLGTAVVRALNTVNVQQGFEAGLAIVIIAIILDRVLKGAKNDSI